ncbi:MAG: DUF2723 domain-containing protein [Elusimicrobia bacterium]|nr:DUF2723 domain-containing protein [Elusimicrobiota bacterium]
MRSRAFWFLAVFLVQAAAGIYFLAPSVSFGDSGELIASVATLSIPHAPGYPLFCAAARVVSEVFPFGTWAWRVNLFSALCGAAAAALLFDAMTLFGLAALPALAGTFFLSACPIWLRSSLQAEVFSLHWLLAAACLWVVCRFRDRALDPGAMSLLGLCLGLGGANHQTLILAAPALLIAAALQSRPSRREALRGLFWLLAFAFLGLLAYAYLPVRSRAFPPLDWGHPSDWPRFVRVLLRRDFGTFSLTVEGPQAGRLMGILKQSWRYLGASYGAFGPVGCALALLGALVAALDRERRVRWTLPALLVLFAGPGFLWLGNPPFDAMTQGALDRFYPLSWMGAAFFIACGARFVVDSAAEPRLGLAIAWALACAPVISAAASFARWGQRMDLAAHDYGRNVLRTLPRGAALFMDGGDDTFFTLAYNQFALGRRPDVELHDRGGLVFRSIYGSDFRRLSKEEKEERRLQVEAAAAAVRPTYYSTLRDEILPGRLLLFEGALRRVGPEQPRGSAAKFESPLGPALWEAYPLRFLQDEARWYYRYRALVPFYPLMRALADADRGQSAAALLRLEEAMSMGPDVLWLPSAASQAAQWTGYLAAKGGDWRTAEAAYRSAERFEPGKPDVAMNIAVSVEKLGRREEAERLYSELLRVAPSAAAWHNLGAMYWAQGRWAEAAKAFNEAVILDPGNPRLARFRDDALSRARRGGER